MSLKIQGQQDPQYTQYVYGLNIINPATVGTNGKMNINMFHRSQWVGVDGAPKTTTLTFDMPLKKSLGIGGVLISDKLGPVTETNFFVDMSYTLRLNNKSKLAFGLKGGFNYLSADLPNVINTVKPSDVAFADKLNTVSPNFGFGVHLFNDKYFVSFAIPNFLETVYFEKKNGQLSSANDKIHSFLMAGYKLKLGKEMVFQPSFLLKTVPNAPMSLDLSSSLTYQDKVTLGVSVRIEDSIATFLNFKVNDFTRIGYAFDYTLSNFGQYNSGSHEVMLLFNLKRK